MRFAFSRTVVKIYLDVFFPEMFFADGYFHREHHTRAFFQIFSPDATVVHGDVFFRQRQSDTRSGYCCIIGGFVLRLMETLENQFELLFGNAGAIVFHSYRACLVAVVVLQGDAYRTALVGIFKGVAQKIVENDTHLLGVTP